MVAPDEVWMRIVKEQGRCNAIKEASDARRAEIIKCLQSYGLPPHSPPPTWCALLEREWRREWLEKGAE